MSHDPATIAAAIRERASRLGFERVGFCDLSAAPAESRHFERWLASGMHATMSWMQRDRARRLDPSLVLKGARTMIVAALSYARPGSAAGGLRPDDEPRGEVCRYALGDDYHRVMGERLFDLQEFIETAAAGQRALAYVDTGPVLERMWAARAGIGWVGKNSLILNKEMGSYFFLGVILTTLPLPPDEPAVDQCGSCALCVEACPTGAIVEPRVVDSRLCLSYHTIELRGPLPEPHRAALGARVFGCDDCQDVCPWNRAGAGSEAAPGSPHFPPRAGSAAPDLLGLLAMTHAEYLQRFRGSAVKRATYRGLRRNAAAALGNVGDGERAARALRQVADDASEDAVVREQAAWSSARVRSRATDR